jgi:hypothetical protein
MITMAVKSMALMHAVTLQASRQHHDMCDPEVKKHFATY